MTLKQVKRKVCRKRGYFKWEWRHQPFPCETKRPHFRAVILDIKDYVFHVKWHHYNLEVRIKFPTSSFFDKDSDFFLHFSYSCSSFKLFMHLKGNSTCEFSFDDSFN